MIHTGAAGAGLWEGGRERERERKREKGRKSDSLLLENSVKTSDRNMEKLRGKKRQLRIYASENKKLYKKHNHALLLGSIESTIYMVLIM